MRIGLHTWGSEGDVRPVLALATALADRGHRIRVEIVGPLHREYEEAAARHGVTVRARTVPGLETPDALDRLAARWLALSGPLRQAEAVLTDAVDPCAGLMTETARELCATSDVVVGHFFVHPLQAVAERTGVPLVTLHLAHTGNPSSDIVPPGWPSVGRLGNRLGWWLTGQAVNRLFRTRINMVRVQEGLAPISDVMSEAWTSRHLTLVAVSQAFCPQPPDWPARLQVCGALEAAAPPERGADAGSLDAFLADGAPPVYCTFGSLLPHGEGGAGAVAAIWRDGLRRAGLRGILQVPAHLASAHAGDGRIVTVPRAPHASVFPRCAAVVHHGGAGTTHATLRAGVPSIVVPHLADQFFWARELVRLGAAGAVVARRRLDAERLAVALRRTLATPGHATRARALQPRILSEDGPARAADLVERLATGNVPAPQEAAP